MSIPTALALPLDWLPGDVLVSLAAEPIYTLRDLFRVESGLTPGTVVELAVMRGPDARLLRLTPEPAPKTPNRPVRRERNREGQSGISPGHVRD